MAEVWDAREALRASRAAEAERLLADPRTPSATLSGALYLAAEVGADGAVALLLADPRTDPAANDNDALRTAAANGRTDVAVLLLADPRVDPAAANDYAIRAAAAKGSLFVVHLLLAHPRVDPAACGDEAVRCAAWGMHDEVVVRLLADPRVDPAALDPPEFGALRARLPVARALARRLRWTPLRAGWTAAVAGAALARDDAGCNIAAS